MKLVGKIEMLHIRDVLKLYNVKILYARNVNCNWLIQVPGF